MVQLFMPHNVELSDCILHDRQFSIIQCNSTRSNNTTLYSWIICVLLTLLQLTNIWIYWMIESPCSERKLFEVVDVLVLNDSKTCRFVFLITYMSSIWKWHKRLIGYETKRYINVVSSHTYNSGVYVLLFSAVCKYLSSFGRPVYQCLHRKSCLWPWSLIAWLSRCHDHHVDLVISKCDKFHCSTSMQSGDRLPSPRSVHLRLRSRFRFLFTF